MASYITSSAAETMALGERIGSVLKAGDLIAFTGGLGAGKTTFCRGLAKGLGSADAVSSPTFAIVNLYDGKLPLAHFDAYRIQTEDDLETAGLYDYLDNGAVVAIEWSENVADFLPPNRIQIDIRTLSNTQREISVQGVDGF